MKDFGDFFRGERSFWFIPVWFAIGIVAILLLVWFYHPSLTMPVSPTNSEVQKRYNSPASRPANNGSGTGHGGK